MADSLKKLNATADAYQKGLKNPNWKVGPKKDAEEFSKGATSSGSLSWENLKKAFKK